MNLILLGAQGSGKGTQAEQLAGELHLKPVASGELLREAMAHGTELGLRAKPYYDAGDLVPDELVIGMILESMRNLGGARGIVLDGFPRNLAQAEALDRQLAAQGQRIEAVVYLDVPRALLLDRLLDRFVCEAHGHEWNINTRPPRVPGICDFDGSPLMHRSDDTPDKIERRLEIFFTGTVHLVDYYGAQGKLVRVDGTGDIGQVNRVILADLRARLPQSVPANTSEQRPDHS
ncbi:MAG: adenylate kinase [Ktedonobacterales bacterium]